MISQQTPFPAVLVVAVALQTSGADTRSLAAVARELQQDVARDDRAAVSRLIRYPLLVFAGGVRIPIDDVASLLAVYDSVFSPAVKAVIARPTIDPTIVQIDRLDGRWQITRINVPHEAPPPRAESGPPRDSRPRAPDRLMLDVGQVTRAGTLASGGRATYLLRAEKNRLLDVRITGVSGRDIVVRITNAKTGAPIDARAREGVRTWSGRVPDGADYRLDVVRLARGSESLPYTMVVSMR
jgi:hypothetical protein